MEKDDKRDNGVFSERYLRQLQVTGWDQEKLGNSSALLAGIGGLGSVSAMYLTAAGIGKLILCDPGTVERSNLNRQMLYTEVALGASKVDVARARLSAQNPEVEIQIHKDKIDPENIGRIAEGCDIIVDGLDNQETRYFLNEYAVKTKKPYIYGAVYGWEGIVGVFQHPDTACLACVISPRRRFTDSFTGSVAGTTPATIGALQSSEAIKILMGMQSCLMGKLLIVDTKCLKFDTVAIEKNKECPVCS
jgi:molybdopterin/thiamine biosynthesis adenylyltransferase